MFLTRSDQKTSHPLTSQSLISSRLLHMRSRLSTLHTSNALGNAFNQPNAHAHFPETAGRFALINITTEGKNYPRVDIVNTTSSEIPNKAHSYKLPILIRGSSKRKLVKWPRCFYFDTRIYHTLLCFNNKCIYCDKHCILKYLQL